MPPSFLVALLLVPLGTEPGAPSAWDLAGAWCAAAWTAVVAPPAPGEAPRRPAMPRGPRAPVGGGRRY